MSQIKNNINTRKIIGLIYDEPTELQNCNEIIFPEDATSEWENLATINYIADTWRSLNFDVILFPLNNNFFESWQNHFTSCHLIHSLVEGFGSVSRESWIPSLCELSGVPYIGSSPFAHSLCMSKTHLKQICIQLNIPTAPFYFVQSINDFDKIDHSFFHSKVFLKPNAEGSGMGIESSFSICDTREQAQKTVAKMLKKYSDGILIEKYLCGEEFTSAVIGTPPQLLPIAKIEVSDGVYGILHKGKDFMGETVTFPDFSNTSNIKKVIDEASLKLFSFIPFYDFVRLDWKCDENGNVYFLEANTLAGLSYYYSVLPLMAKEIGINYPQLFQILYESAMTRSKGKNLWYGKSRLQGGPRFSPG